MFDLVITDYNMPEMDGLWLLRHIRGESWQSSVPVLMVTSETNPGGWRPCVRPACPGFATSLSSRRWSSRVIEAALTTG